MKVKRNLGTEKWGKTRGCAREIGKATHPSRSPTLILPHVHHQSSGSCRYESQGFQTLSKNDCLSQSTLIIFSLSMIQASLLFSSNKSIIELFQAVAIIILAARIIKWMKSWDIFNWLIQKGNPNINRDVDHGVYPVMDSCPEVPDCRTHPAHMQYRFHQATSSKA